MVLGETARRALTIAEAVSQRVAMVEATAFGTKAWAEAHDATCLQRHSTINDKIDALMNYQRWQSRGIIAILLTIVGVLLLPILTHLHFD